MLYSVEGKQWQPTGNGARSDYLAPLRARHRDLEITKLEYYGDPDHVPISHSTPQSIH